MKKLPFPALYITSYNGVCFFRRVNKLRLLSSYETLFYNVICDCNRYFTVPEIFYVIYYEIKMFPIVHSACGFVKQSFICHVVPLISDEQNTEYAVVTSVNN